MKIFKQFKITNNLSTKEFTISKNTNMYCVDVIVYGTWYSKYCKSLKECFKYIRSYL